MQHTIQTVPFKLLVARHKRARLANEARLEEIVPKNAIKSPTEIEHIIQHLPNNKLPSNSRTRNFTKAEMLDGIVPLIVLQ